MAVIHTSTPVEVVMTTSTGAGEGGPAALVKPWVSGASGQAEQPESATT